MENNIIFIVSIFIVFLVYIIVRHFIIKAIQNDKIGIHSKKVILTINIISVTAMTILISCFFADIVQKWQNGEKDIFSLIIIVILTIGCIYRFWNKFKKMNYR